MEQMKKSEHIKVDKKEFDIPTTLFVRDIEDRVFQGIVLQSLSEIDGITLVEGTFIDTILGRDSLEGIKGIYTEQDSKRQCVSIKVEVNICYGISIPKKAEEIQVKIVEIVTKLTGLHVSSIHVVFKNIVPANETKKFSDIAGNSPKIPAHIKAELDNDYRDEF
jgi:uncharacterized alkaline shock family protein YloU